ncbi:MAG: methylmalonyl-CoA epimerase [Actinobacteria bacterium]|nr:methylmalonyl-CoA epimerase [Actinomycetota bacterium]
MKFRQIALGCDDLVRAREFYTRLLGKKALATFDPPGFCFFDMDGTRLMIEVGAPRSLIYIEGGFNITTEPHVVFPDNGGIFDKPGNEWLAFVEDSEGNNIGLMSREVL